MYCFVSIKTFHKHLRCFVVNRKPQKHTFLVPIHWSKDLDGATFYTFFRFHIWNFSLYEVFTNWYSHLYIVKKQEQEIKRERRKQKTWEVEREARNPEIFMWTVKEMLSLFIRYLSAFLFGICPPEPVYICLRATPHVLHLIIQRSPKSWPEAQSHLCEFWTICICDCLHNKRDRLHVCFIRKIWLAYGIPNIYGFFYTTAIWGQEFLHLKVRTFATKLCVN